LERGIEFTLREVDIGSDWRGEEGMTSEQWFLDSSTIEMSIIRCLRIFGKSRPSARIRKTVVGDFEVVLLIFPYVETPVGSSMNYT